MGLVGLVNLEEEKLPYLHARSARVVLINRLVALIQQQDFTTNALRGPNEFKKIFDFLLPLRPLDREVVARG